MSTRFDEMRQLLQTRRYFKLVCGAGNENAVEVRRLATIYTLAGATGFDVSASPAIVEAARAGIADADRLGPKLGRAVPIRPFITVSVGMPGDHHVRKARIDPAACVACGACLPVCPTNAIPADYRIHRELCIGCGHCEAACPPKISAVSYEHHPSMLAAVIPECRRAGAENVELHAAIPDTHTIAEEWKLVCELNHDNFVSMCLDRFHLSNFHLMERIRMAHAAAGERLIIQADGIPMSGGSDDYNTTLQALAIADIINKEFFVRKKGQRKRSFYLLLSGGTNGKSAALAALCGVAYHGLSIGTHARKLVRHLTADERWDRELALVAQGVALAQALVETQAQQLATPPR